MVGSSEGDHHAFRFGIVVQQRTSPERSARQGFLGVKPIHPQFLVKLVSDAAVDDAVFTFDVGTPTIFAARYRDQPDTVQCRGHEHLQQPVWRNWQAYDGYRSSLGLNPRQANADAMPPHHALDPAQAGRLNLYIGRRPTTAHYLAYRPP